MKRAATVLFVLASLSLASAGAADAKVRLGQFVGKSGTTAVGVALGAKGSLAYVCDGKHLGTWFRGGALKGGKVALRAADGSKLSLRVDGRKLGADFGDGTANLRAATGEAGLYRSENKQNSKARLAGWVVLPSGKQVGTLLSGTLITTAPTLSTTSFSAGSLLTSSVVDASDVQPIVLDFDGDGLNVDGTATTTMLGGGARTARWTVAGDDDAFIGIDAGVLATKGYVLSASGLVLARGGLTVTRGKTTTTAVDGFHLLRVLDSNADGRLTAGDPAFEALRVVRDANADGDFGDTPGLNGGSDLVAEMAAMNMEFLALQAAYQFESRKFTALSNASKSRTSLVLNAIRSIKG